jgi:hypothetical protein
MKRILVAAGLIAAVGCGDASQLYDVDGVAVLEQPSICGPTTDWQHVELYDGTLGVTTAFVANHQAPVGRLIGAGVVSSSCTGTIIGPDLFLTAGHCDRHFNGDVHFNYQLDPSGNLRQADVVAVAGVVERMKKSKADYAILRLARDVSVDWGRASLAAFPLPDNDELAIIQHPTDTPKVVEAGFFDGYFLRQIAYRDLDTDGGSSGAGVLQKTTGYVVGVHTSGGCEPHGEFNRGYAIADLANVSETIRNLAMDPAKVVAILASI